MGCSGHEVCAFCSLKKYLSVRLSVFGEHTPLFVNSFGDALKKNYFVDVMRLTLSQSGLDPSLYSGHSFRAGAATTAGNVGFKDWELKMLGGWKSSAFNVYLRNPKVTTPFAERLVSA
jgi:hypothetical protein